MVTCCTEPLAVYKLLAWVGKESSPRTKDFLNVHVLYIHMHVHVNVHAHACDGNNIGIIIMIIELIQNANSILHMAHPLIVTKYMYTYMYECKRCYTPSVDRHRGEEP